MITSQIDIPGTRIPIFTEILYICLAKNGICHQFVPYFIRFYKETNSAVGVSNDFLLLTHLRCYGVRTPLKFKAYRCYQSHQQVFVCTLSLPFSSLSGTSSNLIRQRKT